MWIQNTAKTLAPLSSTLYPSSALTASWRQPGDQWEARDDSSGGTGGMLDHAGLSLVRLSPHSAGSDPEHCDVNLGWFGQSQCPGQSVLDTDIASLNRFYSQPPGLSSLDTEIQKLTLNEIIK